MDIMDTAVIDALKNNAAPFVLMAEELRNALLSERFLASDIECLQSTSKPQRPSWLRLTNYPDWRNTKDDYPAASTCTYRLRADYTPPVEDEYDTFATYVSADTFLRFRYEGLEPIVCVAPRYNNFAGYLYENGEIRGSAVYYQSETTPKNYTMHPTTMTKFLQNGEVRVLRPTHVVFRKGQ